MKFRPQFNLRTLLVVVAMAAITLGWVMCQLEWIRHRREFMEKYCHPTAAYKAPEPRFQPPWQLRLFGARSPQIVTVRHEFAHEAKRLFPEAYIAEREDSPDGSLWAE